jgi:cysteine desulfurase/selenocysteine lyase
MKFEAGTPGIVQQIGLGVALDYLMGLGMENVAAHERACATMPRAAGGAELAEGAGHLAGQGAIFSFTLEGPAHAHDISTVLDKRGIAVRAGTHCAMPLMAAFRRHGDLPRLVRAVQHQSEVDALISALELCHDLFG